MTGYRHYFLTLASLTIVIGCEGKSKKKSQSVSELQSEMIEVPVTLTSSESLSLAQVQAASYEMELKGCASGRTFSFSASPISLYKGDSGCYVVLKSFKISDQEVDPGYSTSTDVSQAQLWEQGDEINYTYNATQLRVKVVQQLSNSIGSIAESVSFSAFESKIGASVTPNISVAPSVSVGFSEAPNFKIDSVVMSGVSEGKGIYNFKLSCLGSVNAENTECDGIALGDVQYALVVHPTDGSGNTISPLLIENLEEIFDANTPSLLLDSNNEVNLLNIEAPSALIDEVSLIFVLKGDGSYRYFVLDDLYL